MLQQYDQFHYVSQIQDLVDSTSLVQFVLISSTENANLFGSKRLETRRHSVAIGGAAVVAAGAEPSPITSPAPSPNPGVMPRPATAVGSMPIPGTGFTPTDGVIGMPRDIPEQQAQSNASTQ